MSRPIFIWDSETTGLSPAKHHIVEIAIMELHCTSQSPTKLSFSSLVHPPGTSAPRAASRVHGITNQMMQDAPSFEKVWEGVLEYVHYVCHERGTPIFIAHNLSFDLGFLRHELARIGEPLPDWDFACSLRDVARIIWPGHSASLASLCKLLRVHNEEAHRALSDVETTSKILAKADDHLRNLSVRMGNGEAAVGIQIRHMIENAAMNRRESMEPKRKNSAAVMTKGGAPTSISTNGAMMTRSRARMQKVPSSKEQADLKAQELSDHFLTAVSIEDSKGDVEGEKTQPKYVTRMGHLWHALRSCQCLEMAVSIRRVTSVPQGLQPCVWCVSSVQNRRVRK
ncbi:unnamed protein product [Agarophyton chilense]